MKNLGELLFIATMAFFNVFLPKMYDVTHNMAYQVGTYASSIILMYILLHGAFKKFQMLTLTIFIKVIPTILLSAYGFFVIRDTKFTLKKGIGMLMILVGLVLLEL